MVTRLGLWRGEWGRERFSARRVGRVEAPAALLVGGGGAPPVVPAPSRAEGCLRHRRALAPPRSDTPSHFAPPPARGWRARCGAPALPVSFDDTRRCKNALGATPVSNACAKRTCGRRWRRPSSAVRSCQRELGLTGLHVIPGGHVALHDAADSSRASGRPGPTRELRGTQERRPGASRARHGRTGLELALRIGSPR